VGRRALGDDGHHPPRVRYGVSTHDPATLVGAALALVAGALVECLVPAWRGTPVDPVVALRAE
jgi:hypothetical protein